MTAFADSQVVFRDLGEDAWGQFRLEVGGRDVTTFRDLPAQVGSYQLTEPYGYGPATFALPALTPFEVDAWGTGELKWMGNGKPVRLIQVDPAGDPVRIVWEGYVDRPNVTDAGIVLGCAGLASGRLSSRIKTSGLFADKKHIGRKIFDALAQVNLRVTPFLGADVGAQVTERGMQSWMIDYVDGLLAATIDTDGSQYTLMPTSSGQWSLALKDTETTDCTAHYGAHGVQIDLADDLTENPNSYYGSGVAPSGLVWSNHRLPQYTQGDPPPYPMDDDSSFGEGTRDSDTDSGDGVTVMMQKLGGTNYLPRTKRPGGFDNDVTRAIKDLQEDAGLTQSGNMNPNTWDALFDVTVTGINLKNSFIHPLAQKSEVRQWLRTANGSIAGANPNYDPMVPQVDVFIDYGPDCEMPRARRNARGQLKRADAKNWAGTITLTSDVFAGDHAHTDVSPTPMSRLDINAGQNIQLRHFDGHTLFHIAVVNVSGDLSVTLGVDVRARDAATLGEIIARRIESRQHEGRQWKRQHLAAVNFRKVEASEDFGVLDNKVVLTEGWNRTRILAGTAGQVSRVRIKTTNDAAKFCVAFFAQPTHVSFMQSKVGNPFDSNAHGESKWTNPGIQNTIDRDRSLLAAFGDDAQPGGYHPRQHTNNLGDVTDAPITGLMLEDAGFDYHTFEDPFIDMLIYSDRDTELEPQRILWAVEENDA